MIFMFLTISIMRWNRGDEEEGRRCRLVMSAPRRSAPTVTLVLSPPTREMWAFTQRSTASWSDRP